MSGSIWDVVWWHPTYGIGESGRSTMWLRRTPNWIMSAGSRMCCRHFNVRHVWGSGDARRELFYQRLTEALAQQGLTEHVVRAGRDTVMLGDCSLKVLNPFSPPMQGRRRLAVSRGIGSTIALS